MNRPNATKMPKVNFLFAKIPFPALFLLLVLSLPFQVISQNLDDERPILLDVKQQLAIPPHSNRGIPHPRPVIGRKLHASTISSLKFHSATRPSQRKFRPEFVTSRT